MGLCASLGDKWRSWIRFREQVERTTRPGHTTTGTTLWIGLMPFSTESKGVWKLRIRNVFATSVVENVVEVGHLRGQRPLRRVYST